MGEEEKNDLLQRVIKEGEKKVVGYYERIVKDILINADTETKGLDHTILDSILIGLPSVILQIQNAVESNLLNGDRKWFLGGKNYAKVRLKSFSRYC